MKKNKKDLFDEFDTQGLNIFTNEKILTNEEMIKLVLKAKNNDSVATWKLIKHNIGIVKTIVKRYTGYGIDEEDLIQEGCIGIINAIKNKNMKFSTYIHYYIKKYVYNAIATSHKSFHVPYYAYHYLIKYRKFIISYYEEYGKYPADNEIANKLNISLENIKRIKLLNNDIISMEEKISKDNNEFVKDRIYNDDNTEETVLKKFLKEDIEKLFIICNLTSREKEVIKYKYGFYDNREYNQKEISILLNISHQRVSTLERKGMKKLKK